MEQAGKALLQHAHSLRQHSSEHPARSQYHKCFIYEAHAPPPQQVKPIQLQPSLHLKLLHHLGKLRKCNTFLPAVSRMANSAAPAARGKQNACPMLQSLACLSAYTAGRFLVVLSVWPEAVPPISSGTEVRSHRGVWKGVRGPEQAPPQASSTSVLAGGPVAAGSPPAGQGRASASCTRRVRRRRGSGENTSSAPPSVPATTHSSGVQLSAVMGPRPPSYLTTHCGRQGFRGLGQQQERFRGSDEQVEAAALPSCCLRGCPAQCSTLATLCLSSCPRPHGPHTVPDKGSLSMLS